MELTSPTASNTCKTTATGITVVAIAAVYMSSFMDRGWFPSDEGLLGHAAERVLNGELPHRDFDDMYTGGLTFLHAAAFRYLGEDLLSLRYVLFAFSILFCAAVYRISLRATGPVGSAVVTTLCFVWSVPNYFAGLPSWYNLFFTVFGTLAMLRFIESDRPVWLGVAGICGGVSVVFKITGLYFVAAVLLFLLYRVQIQRTFPTENDQPARTPGTWPVKCLTALITTSFAMLVWGLVSKLDLTTPYLFFFVPCAAISVALLCNEWISEKGNLWLRLKLLTMSVTVFLTGVVIPVAILLVPYVQNEAVNDLLIGVLVTPNSRAQHAWLAPSIEAILIAPILAALVLSGSFSRQLDKPGAAAIVERPRLQFTLRIGLLVVAATLLLICTISTGMIYRVIWHSVQGLCPWLGVAGMAFVLVHAHKIENVDKTGRQKVFLLVALAVLTSLIQFPWSESFYFCYCAPMVIFAITMLAQYSPRGITFRHQVTALFYMTFMVAFVHPGYMAISPAIWKVSHDTPLGCPRASLIVSKKDADRYTQIVDAIHEESSPGDFIYAAPDCPEIFFLSQRRNPLKTMYDFMDGHDSAARTATVKSLFDDRKIRVAVLRADPYFSNRPAPETVELITTRFPRIEYFGSFLVALRSREDVAAFENANLKNGANHGTSSTESD